MNDEKDEYSLEELIELLENIREKGDGELNFGKAFLCLAKAISEMIMISKRQRTTLLRGKDPCLICLDHINFIKFFDHEGDIQFNNGTIGIKILYEDQKEAIQVWKSLLEE